MVGDFIVVLVAALAFAGGIVVDWHGPVNRTPIHQHRGRVRKWRYATSMDQFKASTSHPKLNPPVFMKKGDRIGHFCFGSAVVILFRKGSVDWHSLKQQERICMGQILGEATAEEPNPLVAVSHHQ
jgi:phosphatidylserine decarboxylase